MISLSASRKRPKELHAIALQALASFLVLHGLIRTWGSGFFGGALLLEHRALDLTGSEQFENSEAPRHLPAMAEENVAPAPPPADPAKPQKKRCFIRFRV